MSVGNIYLDHAGTTLYANSLLKSFSHDMMSKLYGNPHSMSSSSQRSTKLIDDVRLRTLAFFNAGPDEYDLVFVANATSAIKLVAESFRDLDSHGFWYGYHVDSHTSLVGVRELAKVGYQCLGDGDVEDWISKHCVEPSGTPSLFAFPAQSNLNGRRLPVRWCREIRTTSGEGAGNVFSLLDAASFVSTASLDVNEIAPDFVALSFYKIFGFPDLGALIVRKGAAHALEGRQFFGGGTVDMVIASGDKWHAKKGTSIHERLEDGTLPFHSIIALDAALDTHERLYGSMASVSAHTAWLAKEAYDSLSTLRHFNGTKACHMYRCEYGDPKLQGPIIAFNLQDSRGDWIHKTEVEKLAATRNIHLRSGSVCNPGGTASSLGWTHTDLRRHYMAGLRCGDDHDVLEDRPTGVLRVSLGAMTNLGDIQTLVQFIREFYVEETPPKDRLSTPLASSKFFAPRFYVEALAVFPIQGCGGFKIPPEERWEINETGLAWDHAWCLVHEKTRKILDSQTYPRMQKIHAIVRPAQRVLRLSCTAWTGEDRYNIDIRLPVAWPNRLTAPIAGPTRHCKNVPLLATYDSSPIKVFFSKVLGVPCTLARLCSQPADQDMPQPSWAGTYRDRLRKLFRQNIHWPRLSCTKHGRSQLSPISVGHVTSVTARSSMSCWPETYSTEAEYGSSTRHFVTSRESHANIVVAEQVTCLANEKYPFEQYDWSTIRVGPSAFHLDCIPKGQSDGQSGPDDELLNGPAISESVSVSIAQINGRIAQGKYGLKPAEGFDSSRRTIAVGDMVLPVS